MQINFYMKDRDVVRGYMKENDIWIAARDLEPYIGYKRADMIAVETCAAKNVRKLNFYNKVQRYKMIAINVDGIKEIISKKDMTSYEQIKNITRKLIIPLERFRHSNSTVYMQEQTESLKTEIDKLKREIKSLKLERDETTHRLASNNAKLKEQNKTLAKRNSKLAFKIDELDNELRNKGVVNKLKNFLVGGME